MRRGIGHKRHMTEEGIMRYEEHKCESEEGIKTNNEGYSMMITDDTEK